MSFYFYKMNEFRIIVASNASKEIYGEINEAIHFYSRLPIELTFPENERWGVALKEITYTTNIPTLTNKYITVITSDDIIKSNIFSEEETLEPGILGLDNLSEYFTFSNSSQLWEFNFAIIKTIFRKYSNGKDEYILQVENWPYESWFPLKRLVGTKEDGIIYFTKSAEMYSRLF